MDKQIVTTRLFRFNEFMRRNSIWVIIVLLLMLMAWGMQAASGRNAGLIEELKKINDQQTASLQEQNRQLDEGNRRLEEIEHQNNCLLRLHIQGQDNVAGCENPTSPTPNEAPPSSSPHNSPEQSRPQNQNRPSPSGRQPGGGTNEPDFDVPILPEPIENILGL